MAESPAETFRLITVAATSIAAMWLGQAGWLLKSSGGRIAMIDPYLSDAAAVTHRLRRVMPAPIEPSELAPDVLLITHTHVDHLDPPTVAAFGSNDAVRLVGSPRTIELVEREIGWAGETIAIRQGETIVLDDLEVTATFVCHDDAGGELGFMLGFPAVMVWHAGDTEYDARLVDDVPRGVDVALLPINGSGGNMNAHEAALLAWQLDPGLAMPMHFGMWSDEDYRYGGLEPKATTDPTLFEVAYRRLAPIARVEVPRPGQIMMLDRSDRS